MKNQNTNANPVAPRKIWDGTPAGYTPIEGDPDVLFLDTPAAQRIHTSHVSAERELKAVLRKRASDAPFLRGVAVHCQGDECNEIVFIEDLDDLASFRRHELLCSNCKAREFYALSPIERSRRQAQVENFWKNIFRGNGFANAPQADRNDDEPIF